MLQWLERIGGTDAFQKCPRDAIIAASHLLFVFTCISHRNIFTSDLSLRCPFSGSCLQTAEAVLLSGSVHSFTHCIRTLISSYRCRTCVGGSGIWDNYGWVKLGLVIWWFSSLVLPIMKHSKKTMGLFGREKRHGWKWGQSKDRDTR